MKENKLIAIIRDINPDDIIDIAKSLAKHGIKYMEISLSNEANGLECIRRLDAALGSEIRLGVGTVCSKAQVDASLSAGATYIITPGWDRELAQYVLEKDVEIYPGVFTPGEIMQAVSMGIETVKLFPAATLGTDYINNLRGPFPNVNFMAVGGIDQTNMKAYKDAGCSSFALGSSLIPRGSTKADTATIEANAKEFNQLLSEES